MTISDEQALDVLDDSKQSLQWQDPLWDIQQVIKTLQAIANDELDYDLFDVCRDMAVFLTCLEVDIKNLVKGLTSSKKRK